MEQILHYIYEILVSWDRKSKWIAIDCKHENTYSYSTYPYINDQSGWKNFWNGLNFDWGNKNFAGFSNQGIILKQHKG